MELNNLQKEIFNSRYAMPGETKWEQCAKRVSDVIAAVEINGATSEYANLFFSSY